MTGADPAATIEQLRAVLSRVADGLFRIDAEPECRLLRDPTALEGVSAALAEQVHGAFERVWSEYPALKDALDHATDADAVVHSDLHGRVATLDADVTAILSASAQIATAWRTALPRVDQLRSVLAEVEADANTIGLTGDDELVQARRLVEHLAEQTARDPLSVDAAPASRAVDRAADRIGELARLHGTLGAEIDRARAVLAELRETIAAGAAALEHTRERVVAPRGLLEPLDPHALDAGDLALARWLPRLEQEAADGRWLPAARGLERWHAVAEGWLTNARRVLAANNQPVERRNELRGRLDAYRAKAASLGAAEDRTLTDALQRARSALFEAPCDLEEAERLVADYAALVSGIR